MNVSMKSVAAVMAAALLGSSAGNAAHNRFGERAPAVQEPPATAPASLTMASKLVYSGELTQGGFIRGRFTTKPLEASLADQPIAIADDGAFFAAFDRDSSLALTLEATFSDGSRHVEEITLTPRKWNIQNVNVAKRSGASEAWWKKRKPEYEAILAARAKKTGAAGWKQDFIWPVKGRISSVFGSQRFYRGEPGSYHNGVDIAPGNGVPFVAPADGVVVLARTGFSLEGGLIIIDHGAGLNSAYLHASKIAVSEGDSVKQGEYIGNVGSTGRSSGPHLHWGLKWNDVRFDPVLFAGAMD